MPIMLHYNKLTTTSSTSLCRTDMYCVYIDDVAEYKKWLDGGESIAHYTESVSAWLLPTKDLLFARLP